MPMPPLRRRRFALWAASSLLPIRGATAQPQRQHLGDMHSHYNMFAPSPSDMRHYMEYTGTTLLAWAIDDDRPFFQVVSQRIKQTRQPAPGELWDYFQSRVERHDKQLRAWNLPKVLTSADVDAALAGKPHVVMASEAANFLEGKPERVAQAHAMGLRHLQLVHYIETPLGDIQTEAPRHDKMPEVTLRVIQACKRLGILVDLSHSTPDFVDAALAGSDAVMVWGHSWVARWGFKWSDWQHRSRALPLSTAKQIAARGGVIGLWAAGVPADSSYPLRGKGTQGVTEYADQIMRMVDWLGPKAVAFGTDMHGVPNSVLANYADLREVADNLASRGLSADDLNDICIGNYARVLKQAMSV